MSLLEQAKQSYDEEHYYDSINTCMTIFQESSSDTDCFEAAKIIGIVASMLIEPKGEDTYLQLYNTAISLLSVYASSFEEYVKALNEIKSSYDKHKLLFYTKFMTSDNQMYNLQLQLKVAELSLDYSIMEAGFDFDSNEETVKNKYNITDEEALLIKERNPQEFSFSKLEIDRLFYETGKGILDYCSDLLSRKARYLVENEFTTMVRYVIISKSRIDYSLEHMDEEKTDVTIERLKESARAYYFYLTEYIIVNGNHVYLCLGDESRQKEIDKLVARYVQIERLDPSFVRPTLPSVSIPTSVSRSTNYSSQASSDGCYVATAIYGSYDCPEVWTLRRYRDYELAKTWYGRAFIHTYYAISPTIVKCFGTTNWFKKMWSGKLNKMVKNLQDKGFESTPYEDIDWR